MTEGEIKHNPSIYIELFKGRFLIMLRRIVAWAMLLFFILLLLNIMIFKLYPAETAIVYGMMIVMFFFMRAGQRSAQNFQYQLDREKEDNDTAEDDPMTEEFDHELSNEAESDKIEEEIIANREKRKDKS